MRINSKGFILIETLAVTVFAASIFVFLFKSVAPLMGYYENRMDQMGNIDSVFNNYTLRKFIYRDEYFNNKSVTNCNNSDSTACAILENQFAIKDLDYTMITCNNSTNVNSLRNSSPSLIGSDRTKFTSVYSVDYCNSLMTQMGARVNNKNHYLLFYVKANKLKKKDGAEDFVEEGIQFYKGRAVKFDEFRSPVFDDEATVELFENAIKEITDAPSFKDDSNKGYLIFYYLYPNPMYEKDSSEPTYKESINILPLTPSSDNKNCFKVQIIPDARSFYRYRVTSNDLNADRPNALINGNEKYYFYHDDYNYRLYKKYKDDSNRIENCGEALKNEFASKNDAKLYCADVFASNSQVYTILKITDEEKCKHYFKDRGLSSSTLNTFCIKNFNNLELPNDWGNFTNAKFAERVLELSDDSITKEIAIVGYDKSCSKDVIIPTELYGYPVTMIGYEAFKNTGVRTITFADKNVIKVVEKNAADLYDSTARSRYESAIRSKLY